MNISRELNQYDTGERLDPHPWTQAQCTTPTDLGKVDFDNDEGATEFILYAERLDSEPSYALRIETLAYQEPLTITVNGTAHAPVAEDPRTRDDHSLVSDLVTLLNEARERGLAAGEIYTIQDMMEEGYTDESGEERDLTEDEARAAVEELARTERIQGRLIDVETISDAITSAVDKTN